MNAHFLKKMHLKTRLYARRVTRQAKVGTREKFDEQFSFLKILPNSAATCHFFQLLITAAFVIAYAFSCSFNLIKISLDFPEQVLDPT